MIPVIVSVHTNHTGDEQMTQCTATITKTNYVYSYGFALNQGPEKVQCSRKAKEPIGDGERCWQHPLPSPSDEA